MAVSRIGNNYDNGYKDTYAAQKNAAGKKTENVSDKMTEKNTIPTRAENAKDTSEKVAADYYSYLQKNYACVSKGNMSISGEYLKKCSGDSAKAKELEDFLKKVPELEKQGYEQLSARNKALGGTVTYYQQTWTVNKDGSIQSTVYSVTETGMTNAERMKKSMEERLERQKEKKEEKEKIEEKKEKEEKKAKEKIGKIEGKLGKTGEKPEKAETTAEKIGGRAEITEKKPIAVKEKTRKTEEKKAEKEELVRMADISTKELSVPETAGQGISVKYVEVESESEAAAMMQKEKPEDAYYPKFDRNI